MNEPQQSPGGNGSLAAQATVDDDDEISIGQILDVVYDGRYLIALVAAVVTAAGFAYSSISRPVYEANILVQVEDSMNAGSSLLGQVSQLFDVKTASSAEIEILRSRMVLSRAADSLRLHTTAQPKLLPLVGDWLARRSEGLSSADIPGLPGYVWGREAIELERLNVPDALLGQTLTLIKGEGDRFALEGLDGAIRFEGRVGIELRGDSPFGPIDLKVNQLVGLPGAHFLIRRDSMLSVVLGLQSSLKIAERGRQSGVIGASMEGTDPRRTAEILNEIARQYVRQNVDRRAEEAANTLSFLEVQLPEIKRSLERSEQLYNDFRRKQGTVDLGEEGRALLQQTVQARTRLIEMQQKREELMSRFTVSHPSVVTLDAQIRQATELIQSLEREIRRLPAIEQDTIRITRDVKVNNELYTGLLNNAQQLRLVRAGKIGNVRLVDSAMVPELPVKPKKSLITLLALALGLGLGLAAAFLRKAMHGGIDDPAQIERNLGLTVYATIPHSDVQDELVRKQGRERKSIPLLATVNSTDAAVESLRSFRTALQFALLDARNNIVMITGPTPALGKSFVAVNFAAVLAAAGKRVLLVDADIRKGYLHQYFAKERGLGLSDLVSGAATLEQVVHREIIPSLDFIATGTLPPNPSELLMNPRLVQTIDSVAVGYDIVILDSAPVLAVSDTAVIGTHVGATFLVARESVTRIEELHESSKRLAQAGIPVKGVLFNDIKPRPGRYGYGYRYGRYRYRYARYTYAPYVRDPNPRS